MAKRQGSVSSLATCWRIGRDESHPLGRLASMAPRFDLDGAEVALVVTWRHRLRRGILWNLEGAWIPVHAQGVAFWHLIRGHRVSWFNDPDLWNGHLGFICCTECRDCNGEDLCIWGHHWLWLDWVMWRVCAMRGHTEAFEWRRAVYDADGELLSDSEGETVYEGSGRWGCDRCLGDMPAPTIGAVEVGA